MQNIRKYIWKFRQIIRKIHTSDLENSGERVEIKFEENIDFFGLDMYQKSHFKRYEFAKNNILPSKITGDFACGTGYGTVMLSGISECVIGADINLRVIKKIRARYLNFENVKFDNLNLLDLNYDSFFDNIVSFETVEHFSEQDIPILFNNFHKALRKNGILIFSTPYLQLKSPEALKMGFHLTFEIDESRIIGWLTKAGFKLKSFHYQNYETHNIEDSTLVKKDFIICIAKKND